MFAEMYDQSPYTEPPLENFRGMLYARVKNKVTTGESINGECGGLQDDPVISRR